MTLEYRGFSIDDAGIILHFVSHDPGPGKASDYSVRIPDGELTGDPQRDIQNISNRIQRKLGRGIGASAYLDRLLGSIFEVEGARVIRQDQASASTAEASQPEIVK